MEIRNGLLISAETLLCFRSATAVCASQIGGRAGQKMLAPLLRSMQMSMHFFWVVVSRTWALRLAARTVQIIEVILPVVVAENLVVPQFTAIAGTPWIEPACRLLSLAGGATVGAILAALCTVYDARLFVALQQAERSR